MAKTFRLRIVTPNRTIVDQPVRSVSFTGIDGSYGILADHAPLMTATVPGNLHYEPEDGNREELVLAEGFAEMLDNELTIVCQSAERLLEIDIERARNAEQRARDRLADRGSLSSEQVLLAETALRRALARQVGVGRLGKRADY